MLCVLCSLLFASVLDLLRKTAHFIPTSSSFLNLVVRWLGELTEEEIRRGSYSSVKNYNADPTLYKWTASAENVFLFWPIMVMGLRSLPETRGVPRTQRKPRPTLPRRMKEELAPPSCRGPSAIR